jgi:hypothetical protein
VYRLLSWAAAYGIVKVRGQFAGVEIGKMTRASAGIDVQELAIPDRPASLVGRAAYVLRVHRWLLLFVAVYFVAAVITADKTGRALILPWGYLQRVLLILGILIPWGIAGYTVYLLCKFRPRRPIAFVAAELSSRFFSLERCSGVLLTLTLLFLHATAFSFFKCMIPDIQPFAWDGWLAACDANIHFGSQPWELLQRFFGYPWFTRIIDFSYVLWAIVIPLGMIWFAIGQCGSRLRMQVLLTNVIAWFLLGNVVATMLSSAGPCYYPHVAGSANPFAPLMQYLTGIDERFDIYALGIQAWLWEGLTVRNTTLGYGISAMPSMHVGTTLLLALAAWKVNRIVASALFVYTVIMMIGSVHLGWHYALDGYVAIVGVWAIWWGIGRMLERDPAYRH